MKVLKGLELHGAKAHLYQWWQVTFSENSCNWDVECEGEDTLHYGQCLKPSVEVATPQSSHAESHTLLCRSHTHLQHSDALSVDKNHKILSSVWQWNVSLKFHLWNSVLAKYHACRCIHKHIVSVAHVKIWCQSFSSARKHSEPKRIQPENIQSQREHFYLQLNHSSQTTSLSRHISVLIRAQGLSWLVLICFSKSFVTELWENKKYLLALATVKSKSIHNGSEV